MQTFKNIVHLRGVLGADAKVPPSDGITEDAFAVLLLATASGTWDIATNEWAPRIDWHRVICPGPFFCGFTRGMRRGDYLEVEGELRVLEQKRGVVVAGERFPVSRSTYAVHAIHIRRLERPLAVVDSSHGDG
jgi:acetamidase/formamidase